MPPSAHEGSGWLLDAVARGDEGALVELLKSGADPDDGLGGTGPFSPLGLAAMSGEAGMCAALLAAGADPNGATSHGDAPIHMACLGGRVDCVELLIQAGARVDEPNGRGAYPLHLAAVANLGNGEDGCVEPLLRAGARPDAIDAEGRSALHAAAWREGGSSLEALLLHGASADLPGHDGSTPFLVAVSAGLEANAARLVAAGADPWALDSGGRSAVELAQGSAIAYVASLVEARSLGLDVARPQKDQEGKSRPSL